MKKPPFPADPLWYKDAIIYEVHVKSFYDSNQDGIGDFPGLTLKLDYLQDLGITCIWLLPFYPSPLRDDGYDISDYLGVHPSYGTMRDFRLFLREAHQRGIRVITELVINHTSDQHPWFKAAREAPPNSLKRNFYVWSNDDKKFPQARIIFKDSEKSNWAWDPVAKAYYWHRFFFHQPDLNFDSKAVRRAVMNVMRFWLDLGVDGLRLDAVPYLVEREGTNCENLVETHAVLKEMRRTLDTHYKDRMFLAEANQWPADVRPYFGDGDECHMAFHFPLMPRMFMALRQEDRHPITEIIRQTPDIPDNCQWALFLRNHDELTLEMVTDEERDYMYREYAVDPLMHLNLGIRRRLNSLLGNNRQSLELLHSLLFSFPGTPVIYYGDEIGMGDNFYLGDRNGVRTPMQWSADRNAGFSRADFARLYSPPIMDPVYGYTALNVEAQQRDTSSFFNWMKRLIALSKRFKTFGRGTLQFLNPANRKVLVYVRRYQEDVSLFVANLSRNVQPAEVDLSAFEGMVPIEMLGKVEFPKIGKLPYFLTLGPHAFYWFQLQKVTAPVTPPHVAPAPEKKEDYITIAIQGGWEALFQDQTRERLEKEILANYLPRQRWYGEKSLKMDRIEIIDWAMVKTDSPVGFLCWVKTHYENGRADLYLVTLGIAIGAGADTLLETQKETVLASIQRSDERGLLHEGLADDGFCNRLLEMVAQGQELRGQHGVIRGVPLSTYVPLRGPVEEPLKVSRGALDQSNSAIRFGTRLFLKLFRRPAPGINPDWEIGRYLTEQTSFDRIAKTAGALEYVRDGEETMTLAIVQGLVKNQGSGWNHAVEELKRYYERVQAYTQKDKTATQAELQTAIPDQGDTVPALVLETVNGYLHFATVLGERTGEMHQALSSHPENPDFRPERLTTDDLVRLSTTLKAQVPAVLDTLAQTLDKLPESLRSKGRLVLESKPLILEKVSDVPSIDLPQGKIRCHGDYHLNQVLWTNNDFVILDFEGEPARPLSERRTKQSPLRDVAGMLRSFHYAAYSGLTEFAAERPGDFERLDPWAKFWTVWSCSAFLKGYEERVKTAGFFPRQKTDLQKIIDLFLWEKVFYEIHYELNNRPDWVRIPLEGMLSLLPIAAPPQPEAPLELAGKP